MKDTVDNKKKWQVVGTIIFALLYPFVSMAIFKLQDEQLLGGIVCVLPPAIVILLLPYSRVTTTVAAVVYFLLMHGGLFIYFASITWGTPA